MAVIFKFPVYHSRCDTCESKFECWTNPLSIIAVKDVFLFTDLPKDVGLKCLELKPFSEVRNLRVYYDGDVIDNREGRMTVSFLVKH